jgi:hypothetical protein
MSDQTIRRTPLALGQILAACAVLGAAPPAGTSGAPALFVEADVCREDLLAEIEGAVGVETE